MSWSNEDPRETIYKRANIVILIPCGGASTVCIGHVETKNNWAVSTGFKEHPRVCYDEKWDPSWYWIRFPEIATNDGRVPVS